MNYLSIDIPLSISKTNNEHSWERENSLVNTMKPSMPHPRLPNVSFDDSDFLPSQVMAISSSLENNTRSVFFFRISNWRSHSNRNDLGKNRWEQGWKTPRGRGETPASKGYPYRHRLIKNGKSTKYLVLRMGSNYGTRRIKDSLGRMERRSCFLLSFPS